MERFKWLINNGGIIRNLVINDFRSRYTGSYLGFIWGFVQPCITVLIYWFVFAVGFRSGDRPDGIPYITWLIVGIVPWFYFSEAVNVGTAVFSEYSYLVKKISFRVGILPTIKMLSSMFTHVFFLAFTICVMIANGIGFSLYWFQTFYYLVAMLLLIMGITLITSSVNVYLKDMAQIVGIFTQIGFWLIPIVWAPESVSYEVLQIFKLNPMYYIVEGYRDSLIGHIAFWDKPVLTFYFWTLTIVLLAVGKFTHSQLKVNFSDVL